MKKTIFVLIAIVSMALASCGNKKTVVVGQKSDSTAVETPLLTPHDSTADPIEGISPMI